MSGMVPEQLPMLSRGSHSGPEDGACLMEYVSVLAGEAFSDRPRCTPPLLRLMAHRVNDLTTDAARGGLAALAPGLIGTSRTDSRATAALVACCAEAAWAVHPAGVGRNRQARRARRRLARLETDPAGPLRAWVRRMVGACYGHSRASVDVDAALTAIAQCPAGQFRDQALHRLLRDASQACTRGGYTSPAWPDAEHPRARHTRQTGGDAAPPQHTPQPPAAVPGAAT